MEEKRKKNNSTQLNSKESERATESCISYHLIDSGLVGMQF